jgi:hypothetical protein
LGADGDFPQAVIDRGYSYFLEVFIAKELLVPIRKSAIDVQYNRLIDYKVNGA